MWKVMLVDDEAIEREGIKMMLLRHLDDIEIVAEASNGRKAVELAKEKEPDIIFMDIQMPVMDGLKATKEITTQLSSKIIMVSAYDTFQYAQEAMRYGVKSYLLKPSKVSELLDAFGQLTEEIRKENDEKKEQEALHNRLERASSLMETDFITSLMLDHIHTFNEADWEEWLHIEEQAGFVVVLSFQSSTFYPTKEEKNHWYETVRQVASEQIRKSFIGPLTGFQVPLYVLMDGEQEEERESYVKAFLKSVHPIMSDIQVIMGAGQIVPNFEQFSLSYEQAIYALEAAQQNVHASYSIYNENTEDTKLENVPLELEKKLLESVQRGDVQATVRAFDTYFLTMQQFVTYKVDRIKKETENVFIVLSRSMQELGYQKDLTINFSQLETATQIKEAAKAHLANITMQIKSWRSNGLLGIITEAKQYIQNNYMRSITLEDVANEVGLSSYYFSKIFKEHVEQSFIEYVTEWRISKAKTYLLDNNLSLKEIAITIGYKDPNYFSRVFKKEVGMSPTDYRKQYE